MVKRPKVCDGCAYVEKCELREDGGCNAYNVLMEINGEYESAFDRFKELNKKIEDKVEDIEVLTVA